MAELLVQAETLCLDHFEYVEFNGVQNVCFQPEKISLANLVQRINIVSLS